MDCRHDIHLVQRALDEVLAKSVKRSRSIGGIAEQAALEAQYR